MNESKASSQGLNAADPTADGRKSTQIDCESCTEDESMIIEAINNGISKFIEKIEARSNIALETYYDKTNYEGNKKEKTKWTDTYNNNIVDRLMLPKSTETVIRENDEAFQPAKVDNRYLADQRYPTTILEATSMLMPTSSTKKYRNNNKTYKKENQNDNDDGNKSNISYNISSNNLNKDEATTDPLSNNNKKEEAMKGPLKNQEAQVVASTTAGDERYISKDVSNSFNWNKESLATDTNNTNFDIVEPVDLENPWASAPLQK